MSTVKESRIKAERIGGFEVGGNGKMERSCVATIDQGVFYDFLSLAPYLKWIMLYPTRLRINLPLLFMPQSGNFSIPVKNNKPGTSCALEGEWIVKIKNAGCKRGE